MQKQIFRRRHLREIFGSDYIIAQLIEDRILAKPIVEVEGRKGYWTDEQVKAAQRKIYELENPPIDLTAKRKKRPLCASHKAQIQAARVLREGKNDETDFSPMTLSIQRLRHTAELQARAVAQTLMAKSRFR